MDIGISLPQFGAHAAASLTEFARGAEEAGFDSFWVGDRSLAPVAPSDIYPGYTEENPYPEEFKAALDPLTALTAAAAVTRRPRLGMSTLNAPWYPPLLLARSLTSLDLVSGGRLDVGLGIGWMRDEYSAVNVPFEERGARLDETLDVLRGVWTQEEFGHRGPHWTIPRAHFGLRPVQQDGPPVYLGGFSAAAMRRVGRRAAGWVGVVLPPEALTPLWDTARRAAEEAGRDPGSLRRLIRYNASPGDTAEEIATVLRGVRETGAQGCFVDLQQSVRETGETLELGARVLDLVRNK
ncbi:TIGR03619 family F420-dependent LLM class oxidoreductase [Streptomyces sp. NPDC001941]|uniref:TIGR03619 family F420-dependent LLM class oxidoreductase n=1 Tax=Streptomyces sp. NPDC001941 TaxID=3154659 RepID=UPI003322E77C